MSAVDDEAEVPPAAAVERVQYAHGYHPDMPLDHYYLDPAPGEFGSLNSSGIPYLRNRSPAHFAIRAPVLVERYGLTPAEDCDTAEAHRGRIVHRIALGKGDDYDVLDFPDFRSGDARKAKAAAIAAGRSVILRKDYADALAQADILRAHLAELFFNEPYLTEVAVLWEEQTPFGVVQCRALLDAFCPSLAHGVDLKSTTDASAAMVTRRMIEKGADTQNRWYSRGLCNVLQLTPNRVQFTTLYAETKPPYGSQPFQLSEAWATSSWEECQLALRMFAQCQAEDRWPGYQRNPRLMTPPPWLISRRIEAQLDGIDLDDEPFPEDEGDTSDA